MNSQFSFLAFARLCMHDDTLLRQVCRLCWHEPQGSHSLCPPASEAFDHIFRMSLNLHGLEEVMPVLKTSHPSGPKDYASMGLTSHIMKTLDKLILDKLQPTVVDPLQFAYQLYFGVQDPILCLLNHVYTNLEKPVSTIRPALHSDKLTGMQVGTSLVTWIVDYLTGSMCACRTVCWALY